MTSPPTGSPANQLPSDEPPFAGKRFLIVEDEYLIALDIQQVLESAGAVATCVGSAADALKKLEAEPAYDLVVLDVMLNRKASTDVANALMARGMPFVFLTGMPGNSAQMKGFPTAPVVEKPYQEAQLIAALKFALSASNP